MDNWAPCPPCLIFLKDGLSLLNYSDRSPTGLPFLPQHVRGEYSFTAHTYPSMSSYLLEEDISTIGLLRWLSGKESTCQAGDLSSIPESGQSPGGGHGSPLQYSCLGNPMGREPDRLQSIGLQRVGYDWNDLACKDIKITFYFFQGNTFPNIFYI